MTMGASTVQERSRPTGKVIPMRSARLRARSIHTSGAGSAPTRRRRWIQYQPPRSRRPMTETPAIQKAQAWGR